MNSFASNLMEESVKDYTENGAVTLSSSLNANLDFFSMASSMRHNQVGVLDLFRKAYAENHLLAIKNLFYLRDIRGGQGERLSFRNCLRYLAKTEEPDRFSKLVRLIPEYGRWDDVFYILDIVRKDKEKSAITNDILKMISEQLHSDIQATLDEKPNTQISLLTKWFPLDNCTKNKAKKELAIYLRSRLFKSITACRKTISEIRKKLHVVEQKMCANEWEKIEYAHVPSRAGMIYSNAFKRHDSDRYREFIEMVNSGKDTMNAGTLYPYEVVKRATSFDAGDEVDALWKSLPDYTQGNSAICVVDTSGSMYGGSPEPISIAVSLGMYFAERNKSAFKDMFITFSADPTVQRITGKTLLERIANVKGSDWGANTNIWKVMKLYLKLAKKSNQEDCPKSIIIISDMEFDQGRTNQTYHNEFKEMFLNAGVPMPNIVYWNVDASGHNVPVKYDEHGIVLVSGKSPVAFKFVMEGKTPLEFMNDVLNGKRYTEVTKAYVE